MSSKRFRFTPTFTILFGLLLVPAYLGTFVADGNGHYQGFDIMYLVIVVLTLVVTILLAEYEYIYYDTSNGDESLFKKIFVLKAGLVVYGLFYMIIFIFRLLVAAVVLLMELLTIDIFGSTLNSSYGIYDAYDVAFCFIMLSYCIMYIIFTINFLVNSLLVLIRKR